MRWFVAAVTLVLAVGCAEDGAPRSGARDARIGLHVAGTVAGNQVAVNDGGPRLVEGNCNPRAGESEDVCFISRNLVGELFVITLVNPGALSSGMTIPIDARECEPSQCDEITDVAVIDVQIGVAGRTRASGGTLTLRTVERRQRYAGSFTIELPDGRLSGEFDVMPGG